MKNKRFWDWARDSDERVLYFDGEISEETWWGDEITPRLFRDELFAGEGDITVWLNSPGGDCVAASQIYAMLMDYRGNVTVKIDGIAASAARYRHGRHFGADGAHRPDDDPQPADQSRSATARRCKGHRDAG